MRASYLAAIAVAAAFLAFPVPAAAELRFRPGAYAEETGGGSTRAGVVAALLRR